MKSILFSVLVVWILPPLGSDLHEHKRSVRLMGSSFELTAVSHDAELARKSIVAAIAEIMRIEKLISSWDDSSETSWINRAAGLRPVQVSDELFELISRSKKVSELTNGAFDITFASIDRIWKFDGTMKRLPSPEAVAGSVQGIDYRNIILDRQRSTVLLRKKGMRIGFGAIGKGYAANKAKALMQDMGIANGLVNAGGDLIAWGSQADGDSWQIGIADPKNRAEVFAWLPIDDLAVVTSGNYEKYARIDGVRYAHIIDPRTGYPAKGVKSVTVVCADAELADALATAVFVLGVEEGLQLVDRLNGIECLIVNDLDELKTSQNLELEYYLGRK